MPVVSGSSTMSVWIPEKPCDGAGGHCCRCMQSRAGRFLFASSDTLHRGLQDELDGLVTGFTDCLNNGCWCFLAELARHGLHRHSHSGAHANRQRRILQLLVSMSESQEFAFGRFRHLSFGEQGSALSIRRLQEKVRHNLCQVIGPAGRERISQLDGTRKSTSNRRCSSSSTAGTCDVARLSSLLMRKLSLSQLAEPRQAQPSKTAALTCDMPG